MKSKKNYILILILFISIFVFFAYFYWLKNEGLGVTFFDVGQGDSALIKAPEGQNVLVDGGPNDKILLALSRVLPFWEREIDLMILTHPHADHFSGLISVLERYKVDKILYTNVFAEDEGYQYWLNLAQDKQVEMINVADLDYVDIGNNCGLNLFYPEKDLSGQIENNLNNTSIVFQLDCQGHKVLFTGDAEKEVEEYLIESDFNLASDVLKVGHHGSDTSSSVSFIEAVKPSFAIISVGVDNDFGHPSKQVLNRLERAKIRVYRTDIDGNISISWPNNEFLVETLIN